MKKKKSKLLESTHESGKRIPEKKVLEEMLPSGVEIKNLILTNSGAWESDEGGRGKT